MTVQSQVEEFSRLFKQLEQYRRKLKEKQATQPIARKTPTPQTLSQCPATARI